jgi:hypothetical protein
MSRRENIIILCQWINESNPKRRHKMIQTGLFDLEFRCREFEKNGAPLGQD